MRWFKLLMVFFLSICLITPAYAKPGKSNGGGRGKSSSNRGSKDSRSNKASKASKEAKKEKSIVNTGWERRADTDKDGYVSEDEYDIYRQSLSPDAAIDAPKVNYFGLPKPEDDDIELPEPPEEPEI